LPCTGDLVSENDVLAQIETDKVTIDVRYTEKEAGTLSELLVKEGDNVAVGAPVAIIDQGAIPANASAPKEDKPAAKEAKAAPPPPPPQVRWHHGRL
jgi:pyruvate/2-oxoglutarate dehydrogenase complex dihydrolipoamide acyltransferase (E2) component